MNKRSFFQLFFIALAFIGISATAFSEPQNIGALRLELRKYHDSGAYDNDIVSVVKDAEAYIDARAKTNAKMQNPAKLAIVLDIDDTTLSNYQDIIERNFCPDDVKIKRAEQRGKSPAINPMLALYKNARKSGVAIFFVTGRGQDLQKPTERNLKAVGYTTWNGIFFRPKVDSNKSVVPYKTQVRANIQAQGYTIVASIGDQDSDLAGGYAEKTFKLPNPYYYLP